MDYKLYLKRIGITDINLPVNTEMLALLQRQHLLHVPFENIDIHNRVAIELTTASIYRKIVENGRGGYCYECNGLFAELLTGLGFEVQLISARVVQRKKIGPEFDHLAIVVVLDDSEWLVDVGFGDFSMKPLLIASHDAQHDGRNKYRLEYYGELDEIQYISVTKWQQKRNRYLPVYLFTTVSRSLPDFVGMNHYHQNSPESHFTQNLICSMPGNNGRITLINNRLILSHSSGDKEEKLLYGPDAIELALKKYFGLTNTGLVNAC